MDKIKINDLKFHAFHGHLPVERKTGNTFVVDLVLGVALSKSGASDQLEDTVDYVAIMQIVEDEMAIPSDLIEHVATRIANKLRAQFTEIESLEVTVKKQKPPLHFDVKSVEVTVCR